MTRLITLRHKTTGKYGRYPEHFADRDDFEVYDPSGCVDCVVDNEEETASEEDKPFFETYEEEEEVDG